MNRIKLHGSLREAMALVALVGCISMPTIAESTNSNMYFSADVTNNNACAIIVQQDGTFVPNANATQLSSKLAGGVPGIADVYSIWGYSVTVDSPGFFQSPISATSGTTFNTTFSGRSIYRGRSFAERPGANAIRLRRGYSITRVSVNLEANRPASFPSGAYKATTIVRCEP